jgi:NifU-like protein involved in Fe-S cluster formation
MTHQGIAGEPGCGPYIILTMRVEQDIVHEARYRTYGCPVMMACGEVACLRSEGEPLERLRHATGDHLQRWVGGVPEGKEHCLELVAEALRRTAGE